MGKNPRDNSIGAHMHIAIQLMKRRNLKAIAKSGYNITLEQLGVLEILSFYGEMNMTELSQLLLKQNANITRIVDKLEKKEFVIRQPVIGDRRAYLLKITEAGKLVLDKVLPIVIDVNKDLNEIVPISEMNTTLKTIKRIINHLSLK